MLSAHVDSKQTVEPSNVLPISTLFPPVKKIETLGENMGYLFFPNNPISQSTIPYSSSLSPMATTSSPNLLIVGCGKHVCRSSSALPGPLGDFFLWLSKRFPAYVELLPQFKTLSILRLIIVAQNLESILISSAFRSLNQTHLGLSQNRPVGTTL